MKSLNDIYRGKDPINISKGCGGVMRIAPIPLYAAVDGRMDILDADKLAGEAAEITHQHPLGFISAALMSHVIYRLTLDENPTREGMIEYIREGMENLNELFPQYHSENLEMIGKAQAAIDLSSNDRTDIENIKTLGEGWTGEEALAIALYCALKHFDSFEDAMIVC